MESLVLANARTVKRKQDARMGFPSLRPSRPFQMQLRLAEEKRVDFCLYIAQVWVAVRNREPELVMAGPRRTTVDGGVLGLWFATDVRFRMLDEGQAPPAQDPEEDEAAQITREMERLALIHGWQGVVRCS